jgi:NADH:ubiquinone oxidoreductase subunit 6 (subunit J)
VPVSPFVLCAAAPAPPLWPILLPAALGMAGIYLLLPRARRYPPLWGGAACGLALALAAWLLLRADMALGETICFYSFSAIAIVSGALLVVQRNPVHAALAFAMVILSTCGLFLLLAAPFLMAATIIIYAGAIVVTFLFVIMLAQQAGLSDADQRSREPFLATVSGFVLLVALFYVLQRTYDTDALSGYITRLDGYIEKMDRAVTSQKTAEEIKPLEEGLETLRKEFEKSLQPEQEAMQRPQNLPVHPLKGKLIERLRTLQLELVGASEMPPPALKELIDRLREIRTLAVEWRNLQGVLQSAPTGSEPTSAFSEGIPSAREAEEELRRMGKLQRRLPANNVAALGRSLFSDYLMAVELAGMLLLVATIGAIAIAGRRTEGLR